MVAHVLRLRFALLFGALRGERLIRTVLSAVCIAAITVVACVGVLTLADTGQTEARTVLVLAGAAILLGFFLGPLLGGAVDQLDPRRFRVFGVDERQLPWTLLVASLVSVPSFAVIALMVCVAIVGVQHGAPWPLAVVLSAIALLSATLAARIGMAANAMLLPERRPRELIAVFSLAVVVLAFPVAIFFASMKWDGHVPPAVAAATDIMAWTPFGAAIAAIFEIARGDVAAAGVTAAMGVATIAGLLALWIVLVRRMLLTTERPTSGKERSGLGWFAVLPSTAFGAVAARSLVYWFRDRRYIVNIVVVPIAGVLTVFPLLVAGVPAELAYLVPVPIMALFFGWLPHNDLAYDSTALWTHVASGMRGVPDRLGRLVPVLLVAVPVLAVAIPVTMSLHGRWSLLLPFTGLTACLLLSGLGLSSIVSVVAPYAVSRPGDSPFQQPQRSASRGTFGQVVAFVGPLALSAPVVWLFVRTLSADDALGAVAFWTGIGVGVGTLLLGAAIGGIVFERSGERLMEFVETA